METDALRKNVMIYAPGESRAFKCECGCNVFHDEPDGRFGCNGCLATYIGEREGEQ